MNQNQLINLLVDQSKDLFWMVNLDLELIYANKSYLSLMKEMTGKEKKLNESVMVEGFGAGYIEKWTSYYNRAFTGDYFEVEEHFFNQVSNEIQYGQTTFEPLRGDDDKIFAVACQSKDINPIVKERKRVEQELILSEKKYKTLFEDSPLPMLIFDFKTLNIIDCNEETLLKYGYTREEFLQLNIRDIRPKEDIALIDEATANEVAYGQIHKNVWRHSKKNGELMQMEITGHLIDYNGRRASLVLLNDVTEKLETQQAILLSNERFNYVNQVTNDAIYDWDVITDSFVWGESFNRIFNHSIKEDNFSLANWIKLMHPDDVEPSKKEWELFLADTNQFKWENEFRFQRGDTSYAFVEEIGFLIRDDNGKPKRMIGVLRDQTQRKKQEQQFKLLESVITNTKDAILITEAEPFDEPGPKIIYVNDAFTKMTGYTAEEVIGKSPRILQGPNSDKDELARLSTAIRNWETCEITTINYKKNGDEFWINFTLTPVADEKGWYTHWIAIEREVTEQKIKELENDLLAKISLNFNAESDFIIAVKALCETISLFGKFDLVEIWITNLEKSHMELFSHYVAAAEDEKFYDYNSAITAIQISEGLAGKVWAQREQLIWDDIENHNDFVRRNGAKKIGLKAIMGIPLLFNGEVKGVLKIGTKLSAKYLKNYTQIFKHLEGFIGSEFNRKKLENDLTHLFDTIPDILCLLDFEGKFLKINKAGCELLGYSEEEILYHNFDEFIHSADIEISFSDVLRSEHGKNTSHFENRCLTKEGEIICLSWHCNSSFEEGLIYATAKNITEENKLRELNRQAGSMSKIGSWEVDLIKQRIFWSDEVHQLHGTDSESFVPTLDTSINFYREDYRQLVETYVQNCMATGLPFDFEAVLVTANNEERWIRSIGNAEFADGKCTRFFGSFQDIEERKKAEQKLIDNEQKYRVLALELQSQQVHLTNAQKVGKIGSWETDLSDLKLIWSDETYRIFGTDRKSFEPTHEEFLQFVHPLDREKVDKAFIKSIQEPTEIQNVIEHRIITPLGEVKDVEERWKITRDDNDEPLLAIGVCQDITERKKAEENIRDSEIKRTLIMNGALDAIICIDTNGIITFWNKQAEVIFGWKEAEVIGQLLSELIIPEQFRRYHNEGMKHYLKTGEAKVLNVLLELSAIRRSGEEFPIELTVLPIKQEGVEVFFCSFIRDITQRKKAEENIIQSNERFEKVTEATNDAIWDWDLVNQTYYRSKGIERFFGKEASGIFPESDLWSRDHFYLDELIKIKDSFYEAIENPIATRWEEEYQVINQVGEVFYVIDRAVIIRNSKGKAIRVVGAMTDISEQKQMTVQLSELNRSLEQYTIELERSNEELEQFAFVASHDLQEPLRMISSFMEQLQRKYGNLLDEKGHQYIHFATDGAKRMKQIILDLLDYSRAGKSTEGKEAVAMNEVLSEYKQLRRKLISEKNAAIISKELPTLNTYKAAINQIFHCLLDNALKYSTDGIPLIIEVNAVEHDNEWEFSIKDNGIGIESQFFTKIFIIFQRLHSNDDYPGTGIGLSIVKRQVEFLGGRIWLESAPKEGSVFYFTIPKTI